MESNTALSQSAYVALYFQVRWLSCFDSLVIGDVMVLKFTGIHTMDPHPLAGLASISLLLETFLKSSAAEGRKEKDRKRNGREGRGMEERGKKRSFLTTRGLQF